MDSKKLMYYAVPKDNFEAEGRVFLKGEKYPVYDKNGRARLIAENGDFLFTHVMMDFAVAEWGLEIVRT